MQLNGINCIKATYYLYYKINSFIMKKHSIVIFISIISIFHLSAQQIEENLLSTSGGFYESTNLSMAWSVGEVMTETFSTQSLILTQGFLQPNDVETGVESKITFDSKISIYPNPSSIEFTIKLPNDEDDITGNNYQMFMYDVNSKLIQTKLINQPINRIGIQNYKSGVYFVKITNKKTNTNETFILQLINN